MARFWFISAPLYSHTDWGGLLKTAQRLQASGHEVVWISEAGLADAIRGAGLEFLAIRATGWLWPPPPTPDFTTIPPQEAVMLRYRRALDTWLSEELVGEAVEALLELAGDRPRPDVIVSDPFLSASALAAEALDIPLAIGGWPAQADLNNDQLFPVQRSLASDSQQRLERLCQRFGLRGSNFSHGSAPAILSPHLHITYFTPEWYLAELALMLPQTRFVGGVAGSPHDPAPEWLGRIPMEMPLAVITLGTVFTGDLGFFSWAAQAVAREGLTPLIALGWNPIEPEKKAELIRALPRGSYLLNWIPLDHVLPRARLMIHHGGMGTTHHAVVHGVPQIVVPHAADQRIQGRRVAQAKIGLNLTAHDVRQGLLWEGTRAILNDGQVAQTARDFAVSMAALGGIEQAAAHLTQLAFR